MAASSSGSSHVLGPNPFASPIQEGNRLYLLGKSTDPDKNLTAYAIGVKTFEKPTFWSKLFSSSDVVPIQGKVNNKKVKYNINVKTVARQIGLTESRVREIAEKVDGIELLRRHAAISQTTKTTTIKSKYDGLAIQSFKVGRLRYFINTETLDLYKAQKLSEGTFGKVFKISSLMEPESPTLALKKAKRKVEKSTADLQKEAEVLRKINSFGGIPGIQAPPDLVAGGSYTTHLYDGGDLINVLERGEFQKLPPKEKLKLMGQLIVGLCHIHKSGYFHGDIKLENCLVEMDKTGKGGIANVVLSDFGGVQETATWKSSENFPHTPHYLAPEIFDMKTFPAEVIQSSDVYALSKTILQALIADEILDSISITQYESLKTIIPEQLAQVLTDGMSLDPEKRPTAEKLLNDFSAAFKQQYGEDLL